MRQLHARSRAVFGQQHQSRTPAAAVRVLRRRQPRGLARARRARLASSCRAAISAMRSPACGRAQLGLPIGEVVLAHNANRTVPDFLASGEWQPRPSIATLASAMDVGNPSNMERLRALFPELHATARRGQRLLGDAMSRFARASAPAISDYGQIWCPHTATAAEAYERLPRRAAPQAAAGCWCRPRIRPSSARSSSRSSGEPCRCRETLAQLFARPAQCVEIDADLAALRAASAAGGSNVKDLSKLPPTAWVLIGVRGRARLRRCPGRGAGTASYRARKALRAAVTARGSRSPGRHAGARWHGRRLPRRLPAADAARRGGASTCATCAATSSAATRWPSGPSWTDRTASPSPIRKARCTTASRPSRRWPGRCRSRDASCSRAAASFPKGLPKWTLMLDALRAEFPLAEFEAPAESAARFREGWQRLKDAVKPSYMVDMR